MLRRLASTLLGAASHESLGAVVRHAGGAQRRLQTSAEARRDEFGAPSTSGRDDGLLMSVPADASPRDEMLRRKLLAPAPRLDLVDLYFSPAHFNAREAFKAHKGRIIAEMQSFEHDTGSYPVQIGLVSERISYLTKHCTQHKKDHHSRRGLLVMLSRRRKMLKYLRRQNFEHYVQVINKYGLKDNYYASGWGEVYRVGTNLKWTPSEADPEGKFKASESVKVQMWAKRRAARDAGDERRARLAALRREIAENRRKKGVAAFRRRVAANADHLPPDVRAAL